MILTTCAACAAPLAHDAPRCVRCKLRAAGNYATSLSELQRFEEARSLMRPIAELTRRLLGESHEITLKMRLSYARALYEDPAATLDDVREAATMFEDAERIARRVLGGAHPLTMQIERDLRIARAALRARETPSPPGSA